jgi:hypothetical protein
MEEKDQPQILGNAIELSMGQKFEMEKMSRAIDSCNSVEELQSLAKTLVSAWMTQKAATAWMIREQIKMMQAP